MKKTLLLLACFFLYATINAQNNGYESKMDKALELHISAKDYQSEKAASDAFLAIAKQNNDWLAYYWASYINTQIMNSYRDPKKAPPKSIPPRTFLDNAQEYIDKALSLVAKENKMQLSDIGALQLLINNFKIITTRSEDKREKVKSDSNKELIQAISNNRENPSLYVMVGTQLARSSEVADVFAGRVLLNEAKRIFNQRDKKRSQSPHFNEEWLDFYWLKFADQKLDELYIEMTNGETDD